MINAKAINITENKTPIISGDKFLIRFLSLHSLEEPNAAISGLKQWVIMCSEAERNPLF
jgi:hypothetical protein